MKISIKTHQRWLWRLAAMAGLIGFYWFFLALRYPLIGHDFCHFLPRMIDADLHYRVNGLSIQWHTPTFGGGMPAFPNPQDIQFSLPQFLMFVLPPWWANQVAIAIMLVFGFIFFEKFCREALGFSWQAGVLAALFFSANGFYIEHMAAGHVSFQAFPLLGVLLYLLFSPKLDWKLGGALTGLLVGYMVYSAGFYPAIIFALAVLTAIPLVRLMAPQNFNLAHTLKVAAVGVLLGGLISAAKVVAVLSFMENFPRDVSDYFYTDYENVAQAFIGVVSQLTMMFQFAGMLAAEAFGLVPSGAHFDQLVVWVIEADVSLSPVLILLLGIGLVDGLFQLRQEKRLAADKGKLLWVGLLLFSFWIVFEFATTEGVIYNTVRQLPLLRSLHYNVRNTAGFIVPLIILGVAVFNRRTTEGRRSALFGGMFVLTFAFLGVYLLLSPNIQVRSCDYTVLQIVSQQIRQGETFPIEQVVEGLDAETLLQNASNRTPRDAIFGYLLEDFHILVEPGSVYMQDGEYYNFSHPQGYLSGNSVELFERFTIDQREMMDVFLQHRQPDWEMTRTQQAAFILSGSTLLGVCLWLVMVAGKSVFRRH